MKKFLLVLLVGEALAISLYGFVNEFMTEDVQIDHIEETTMTVYME